MTRRGLRAGFTVDLNGIGTFAHTYGIRCRFLSFILRDPDLMLYGTLTFCEAS